MSPPPDRDEVKAIRVPSGDHAGSRSAAGPAVMGVVGDGNGSVETIVGALPDSNANGPLIPRTVPLAEVALTSSAATAVVTSRAFLGRTTAPATHIAEAASRWRGGRRGRLAP